MAASQPSNNDPPFDIEDPFAGTEYRALSLLGSGGMGDVYVVERRKLKKIHAAKLLRATHAADKRIVDRIRLEAHALAKLQHPNVVQIHEFAVTPSGLPFIVMELLRGRTLKDELATKGPLELNYALIYAADLLSGLEAVHQLGIVHRDIKPSNLFLHADSTGEVCLKMLDFGVARVIPGISEHAPAPLLLPTRTGTVVGTPIFISPEAALGQPVDVRTDIYNAAIMLYVMLTGRGPFDHLQDNEAIIHAHAHLAPPPPAHGMKHWLGERIDQVVLRGLAKDPNDRYQTAAEFAQAIYELMQECVRAIKEAERRESKTPPEPEASAPPNQRDSTLALVEPQQNRLKKNDSSFRFKNVQAVAFVLVMAVTTLLVRLAVKWSLR
jgi:serine/threonine protein kinase